MGNKKYEVGDFIQTEFGHYVVWDIDKSRYADDIDPKTFIYLMGILEECDTRMTLEDLEKIITKHIRGENGRISVLWFKDRMLKASKQGSKPLF